MILYIYPMTQVRTDLNLITITPKDLGRADRDHQWFQGAKAIIIYDLWYRFMIQIFREA